MPVQENQNMTSGSHRTVNDVACEWMEAIFEASPIALIGLDLNAQVIFWSPSAEKIFGWEEEEVLGRPHPVITSELEPAFHAHFYQVLYGENYPGHQEIEHKTKDGRMITVSVSVSRLHDSHGVLVGAMGALEDITERLKAQDDLIKSELRYKNLLETMSEGFIVYDDESKIIYANTSFIKMLGYPKEDVIGENLTVFFDDKNKEKFLKYKNKTYFEIEFINNKNERNYSIFSSTKKTDLKSTDVLIFLNCQSNPPFPVFRIVPSSPTIQP